MNAPLMLSVSGARGIVGQTMTPIVAANFAAAFAAMLLEEQPQAVLCLGRDSRPSGDMLARAAAAGALSTGCGLIDLGVVTTPTVGLMVERIGAAGGLMVTASHNPIEWNGLKCLDRGGVAPPKERAQAIVARFREGRARQAGVAGIRQATSDPRGSSLHVESVLSLVDVERIRSRRFHVVLDSVNGAGGPPARLLLENLGCTIDHLNAEPTGQFTHAPEPIESNLGDLCAAVTRAGPRAACGMAQDPDADRLAIVDERGRFIGEEYTLVLAAQRMLQRRGAGSPPITLVANLSTSRMLDDLAARFPGATVLRTAVGEANVVAGMRARGAVVGGEGNGGVIVPEVCWVRDSLSAMALLLDLLAAEERPLSELITGLPRYEMIKHKFELSELPQAAHSADSSPVTTLLSAVKAAFADQRLDDSDGVRVDFSDGWVHLRPSNTEPIVRLIAEAPTRERVWELIDEVAVAAKLR
jgi:phosphomannomutase